MARNILPNDPYPSYRSGSESPRFRRRGMRWNLSPAFSGPDVWSAVRPQLTEELRAACVVLVEMEQGRQLPATPATVLHVLAPVTGEQGNGSRRRTQRLLDRLVELRILRPFGRRNEKFDLPAPGLLVKLLQDPHSRESVLRPVTPRGR